MAGERELPGLGFRAYWTPGSNGWGDQRSEDIRLTSVLLQGRAKSRTTVLPGAPVLGDVYIVRSDDGSNPDEIAIWDGEVGFEAWVYVVPQTGWKLYVIDDAQHVEKLATGWTPFQQTVVNAAETAAFNVTDTHFKGNRIKPVNFSTDLDITVPSGLTGKEPCTFISTGAGIPTFVAGGGVTIISAEVRVKIRTTGSSATLIPAGVADTYYLVGDIEA